jgi:hypothetical protein
VLRLGNDRIGQGKAFAIDGRTLHLDAQLQVRGSVAALWNWL